MANDKCELGGAGPPVPEQQFDPNAPAIEDEIAALMADVPESEWAKLPPSDEMLDPQITIRRLQARIAELEGLIDEAFRYLSTQQSDGWWSICGSSTACDLGDTLVKAGLWECHLGVTGRRQFYRPIAAPAVGEANDGT